MPPKVSILSYLVVNLFPLPSPRSIPISVSHCQRSLQRIQFGMPNVDQATLKFSWSNAVTTQNTELLFNIPTEASSSVGGRWTGYMYTWPPTRRVWSGSGILRESVTIWLRLCTKAQCLVWASATDYLIMILHKWVPNPGLKLDSLVSHWTSMLTNVYMIGIPRVYSIQISPEHV